MTTYKYTITSSASLRSKIVVKDAGNVISGATNSTTAMDYTVTGGDKIQIYIPLWINISGIVVHSPSWSSGSGDISSSGHSLDPSDQFLLITVASATQISLATIGCVNCKDLICPECGLYDYMDETNHVSEFDWIMYIGTRYTCMLCGYDDSMLQKFINQ